MPHPFEWWDTKQDHPIIVFKVKILIASKVYFLASKDWIWNRLLPYDELWRTWTGNTIRIASLMLCIMTYFLLLIYCEHWEFAENFNDNYDNLYDYNFIFRQSNPLKIKLRRYVEYILFYYFIRPAINKSILSTPLRWKLLMSLILQGIVYYEKHYLNQFS